MVPIDEWFSRARCTGLTSIFFTETTAGIARAKAICTLCPVRDECLDYALRTKQEYGVWGGLSENERVARMRRATAGGQAPIDITYTTNARSTGATCSAGRSETGWSVICRAHDAVATACSRTIAEFAVSRPEEWCPGCRRIASGYAPRVNATL